MRVNFWLCGKGQHAKEFDLEVPDETMAACKALPKHGGDRIGFLRGRLNDDRFAGHVMIWQEI